MDKLNYFKKDERNNYMPTYSNKSDYGNDQEDNLHGMYRLNNTKLEKVNKPEPENSLEMSIPVR